MESVIKIISFCILFSILLFISCSSDPSEYTLPSRDEIPLSDSIGQEINTKTTYNLYNGSEPKVISVPLKDDPIIGNPYEVGISTIHSNGEIYVFDKGFSEVKIYKKNGSYIRSFGEVGAGPGAFQSVVDFSTYRGEDGKTGVVVISRSRRVQFFKKEDGNFKQVDRHVFPFEPRDVCSIDGSIFVHGGFAGPEALTRTENSIFKLGRGGEVSESFGPMYQHDDWLVKYSLSEGVLACDQSSSTVVFSFMHSGVIYGYNKNGVLKWVSEIKDFKPDPRSYDDGSITTKDISGVDRITNIIDTNGDSLVVERRNTVKTATSTSYPDYSFHHYIISSSDGSGYYVGNRNMIILGAGSDWIAGVNESSPESLKIMRY